MSFAARLGAALAACILLAGCMDREPVRIGFIGELTGPSSDLGEAGRNGVMLAIDQYNSSGGLNGRRIELLARDTGNTPDSAIKAASELRDARVLAVIGPMTSTIAETLVPFHNAAQIVLLSPSVTATQFAGNDDYFFRINWTTRDDAQVAAAHCLERGMKRLAAAVNMDNHTFTTSWMGEFKQAFEKGGGQILAMQQFHSADESLLQAVQKLLALRPDGLVFVANAGDSARLAQQTRKLNPRIPLLATEWAGTEQLIELGGSAVEGMTILMQFDVEDRSPRYTDFQQRYMKRFGRLPGAPSILAHDAGTVLLDTLARRHGNASLKAALTELGPFEGLQGSIQFDRYGDTRRTATMSVVRNGRLIRSP